MRVAHLTTVDSGLRYLLMPQLKAVIDEGGTVAGISAAGPYVEELELAGVEHFALRSSTRGMNPLADLKAARELWHILRREKIDVLHTHNPKPGVYGRIVGRLAGVPVVVNTVHGLYATDSDRLLKRILVYGLEALAARFSDAELVQSAEDCALLTRRHITRLRATRHLGNGVDLVRFDPNRFSDQHRSELRKRLSIREDQIVVGMVGRLVAEKGYLELFEAASLLDDRYVILTAGHEDPSKSDALTPEAVRSAERRGIRFLGMRADIEELYRAMDIFVLPSYREGFPRAAMEAAAMGLPVIATDIRGCREVVSPGLNGLLITPKDAVSLAHAICELGDDPELRATMGQAGRERASEQFDERDVIATVLETYKAIAERKGLNVASPASEVEPGIQEAAS